MEPIARAGRFRVLGVCHRQRGVHLRLQCEYLITEGFGVRRTTLPGVFGSVTGT